MTRDPIVGVTGWRGEFSTYAGDQFLHTLEETYSDAIIEARMVPFLIPNRQDPSAAERIVAAIDGLILTGGTDIDPDVYGAGRVRVEDADIAVDLFEIALLTQAREQGKPLLAICRGLQILNVALGGTLNQDVTSPGSPHEPIGADFDPDDMEQHRHSVIFEPGAILAGLYGSGEIKVNSLHHQGIDRVSPDLVVEGRAPDGLVEAVRCDGWWALGVQWHPERLEHSDRDPLFRAFREQITPH